MSVEIRPASPLPSAVAPASVRFGVTKRKPPNEPPPELPGGRTLNDGQILKQLPALKPYLEKLSRSLRASPRGELQLQALLATLLRSGDKEALVGFLPGVVNAPGNPLLVDYMPEAVQKYAHEVGDLLERGPRFRRLGALFNLLMLPLKILSAPFRMLRALLNRGSLEKKLSRGVMQFSPPLRQVLEVMVQAKAAFEAHGQSWPGDISGLFELIRSHPWSFEETNQLKRLLEVSHTIAQQQLGQGQSLVNAGAILKEAITSVGILPGQGFWGRLAQGGAGNRQAKRQEMEQLLAAIRNHPQSRMSDAQAKTLQEIMQKAFGQNPMESEKALERLEFALTKLPWLERGVPPVEKGYLAKTRSTLDKTHYGLDKVKDRVVEFMATEQRAARLAASGQVAEAGKTRKKQGKILCLVSPPGTGKTSLGEAIARATGRGFAKVELGGSSTATSLQGHEYTFSSSEPGEIARALSRASNGALDGGVIMLDEIDKLGHGGQHGNPVDVLVHILDPDQNHEFRDKYLGIDLDLSNVLFIVTANDASKIPDVLRDRLEMIYLDGYGFEDKVHILKDYLLPRVRIQNGLTEEDFPTNWFTDELLKKMVWDYAPGAGVRSLAEGLDNLARKWAVKLEIGGNKVPKQSPFTPENLYEWFDKRDFYETASGKSLQPGRVYGMYASEVRGGGISPLSVQKHAEPIERKEDTPYLTIKDESFAHGDMMANSMRRAVSYIRTNSAAINKVLSDAGLSANIQFDPNQVVYLDFNSFRAAEGIDGPSAGIAMTAAALSSLTGLSLRGDTSMTGEITDRGEVIAIGGLKQKLEGAWRAGIKRVLIPAENAVLDQDGKVIAVKEASSTEAVDLSPEIFKNLEVIAVQHFSQAIPYLFADANLKPLPGWLMEMNRQMVARQLPTRMPRSWQRATVETRFSGLHTPLNVVG